ncbi:MAG TPA: 2-oxoacid:ferredoxin oxidoreductase subunit beta, partial [Candidatus Thorarchaeota archaeon]|nr:2-oxoacid:ferredoxin oxidoreductase subunit beta [Candidatus Thorarchaeota archaeon]
MVATEKVLAHPMAKFMRTDRLPWIYCPGCSIGIVTNMIARAIESLGIDFNKVVIVSGIGCTGRVSGYFKTGTFHTTHGRAIAFAEGVKIANPELEVIVVSGDGDIAAIGGNHLIHACRRNIDITVVCVNNFNYGMTGGQFGPTTEHERYTQTSPQPIGNIEWPFNLVKLAASSGATFVARWTAVQVRRATKSIEKGIAKKGFSFIEIVGACPTSYGRRNRLGDSVAMHRHLLEVADIQNGLPPHEAELEYDSRIVCGEFVDIEKPEYT